MRGWIRPRGELTEAQVQTGMRLLLADGVMSQCMAVLAGGAFLVALALELGASNRVIGLIAAIGPLTQVAQIPAIALIDWVRSRRALVVLPAVVGRGMFIGVAALPWLAPEGWRLGLLLAAIVVHSAMGAISGCAFNSWMRDLIPEGVMGRYFGRRLALAIGVGAAVSVLAGVAVDLAIPAVGALPAYGVLFGVAATFGFVGVGVLARVPEPEMPPPSGRKLIKALTDPLRDAGFRRLLVFLGSWNFAVNIAGPFFVVYMLSRLGLSLWVIVAMGVLTQVVNVVFFRVWGQLADRLSNKSVLSVSGTLFILTFLLWPFTTLPERHALSVPLLVVIHLLMGVSTAGVLLCSGNIALRAAPRGDATAYLATAALVNGLAATVAPVLAGFAADYFATHELSLTLAGSRGAGASAEQFELPAFSLRGLDFLFVAAFVLGLYALKRLIAVREEGEVHEQVVLEAFYSEVRRTLAPLSQVGGLRVLTTFPFAVLRQVRRTPGRLGRRRDRPGGEAAPPEGWGGAGDA